MLGEAREWERHCKSVRHLYLVNLEVHSEQEVAFQEAQIKPFPVGTMVRTHTAWNMAWRMWAAHQFAHTYIKTLFCLTLYLLMVVMGPNTQ